MYYVAIFASFRSGSIVETENGRPLNGENGRMDVGDDEPLLQCIL